MKKNIIYYFLFFNAFILNAQQNTLENKVNDNVEKEIYDLKTKRVTDSLKMESLQNALNELIDLQKKEYLSKIKASEDSVRIKAKLSEIEKIKSNTQGAPVVIENDTILTIYANLAAYTNKERAKTAQQRILALVNDPFFHPDSLRIGETYGVNTIDYKSNVILAVDETDALWLGLSKDSLSNSYKNIIADSVIKIKKENSFQTKIKQFGELILILFIVFSVIYGINKLIHRLKIYFVHQKKFLPNGISFKNYQLIPKRILNIFVSRLLTLFKYFLFLLVLLSSSTIALKIFPSTHIWAKKAENTILEPLKLFYNSIVNYIPNFIILIIIVTFVNWLLSIIKYFAKEIEQENLKILNFYPEWAKPTYQLIKVFVVILSVIISFPYLPGSGTTAFQGVSVFLGILISIGSSSAIANAVAGIVITYMRPFKINDWIKTGEITGLVLEKNTLVTRLKTINNEDVTVPNSAILGGATINFSSIGRTDGLVVTTEIEIDYNINFKEVEKLLIKAANITSGITNRLAPYIFYKNLKESTTVYEINAITFEPQNMYFIKSDLIKNIQKVFKEADVPLRSVSFIQIETNKN